MDSPFSISTNTPSRSTSTSRPSSANKNTRASNSKFKSSSYTLLKQDQQARNKEPDDDNYDGESSDEDLTGASYDLYVNFTFLLSLGALLDGFARSGEKRVWVQETRILH